MAMNYRAAVFVTALIILGAGLWFIATHVADYLKQTNFVNTEGRWQDSDGDGYLELNICNKNGCSPWTEVQSEYANRLLTDAVVIAAGAGALLILFVRRRQTRARNII